MTDTDLHEACRRTVDAHAAGSRQLLAEIHHIRQQLLGNRPDTDTLTIADIRAVLNDHTGPGLVDDQPQLGAFTPGAVLPAEIAMFAERYIAAWLDGDVSQRELVIDQLHQALHTQCYGTPR